jgi:hypothetical protein
MSDEVDQLKDALPARTDATGDPPRDQLEPPGEDPPLETGPAAAAAPAEGEPEPEPELEPAYKTDPRNEIYARRSAALEQEQQASDSLFSGDDPAAAARALANQGRTVKIVVNGQEREIPESEAIQAGVRHLQIGAAAEQKMTEAARKEQANRVEETRLLRIAANLRNGLDEHGQPIGPKPPSQGADGNRGTEQQMKAVKDAADAYHKAVFSGDIEASNTTLLAFNEVSAKVGGGPGLPEVIKSVEDAVLRNIDARRAANVAQQNADTAERDRVEANRIFREDFPEVTKDPDVFAMAKGLASTLSQDPDWAGKSRAAIAKEVGTRIKAKLQPTSLDATLTGRRQAKKDLSRPTAGGRMPATAEPTVPSNSDYVRQLQVNSGSNSVPR